MESLSSLSIGGAKASFFDSAKVLAALDKGAVRALSKCGAFVRQTAKSSIRYGKKSAKPGAPPVARRSDKFVRTTTNKKTGVSKTRATSPLKELLFFGYDAERKSVVVGPAIFRGAAKKSYLVPTALEKGGQFLAVGKGGIVGPVTIAPHPFMGPALRKEMPKFAGAFSNIMKRS